MTPPGPDTPLPPVAPEVVASAVEGLTTRLRGRLDAAVKALAAEPVTAEDGTFRVRCGEDTWVTLTPAPSGTVTEADQARCTCLLAPRCLHRAAVLTTCPLALTPATAPNPATEAAHATAPNGGPAASTRPAAPTAPAPTAPPTTPSRTTAPPRTTEAPWAAGPNHGAGADIGASPGSADANRGAGVNRGAGTLSRAEQGRFARPGGGRTRVPVGAATSLSAEQVRAASGLWTVAAAVLSAGTAGAGAVLQTELLRAAHTARLAGLHRAEDAALGVVRGVREARDPHGGHSLPELVSALRELLLVTRRLTASDPDPALIGAVRHHRRPDGPLRLYGVCREAVIGPGALGGVVTHFTDDDGRWYTLRDVEPGGPARARRAGTAHVAIRSFLSDHHRLSRGGLIISGAVVSPDGRLLPERGVRATFAGGRPWTDAVPAPAPAPAFAEGTGHARPLTRCDVEIAAADGEDLLVRVLRGGDDWATQGRPAPGPPARLAPAHRHPALAHTANLRLLGAYPGLRIRVVGRVDPDRVTTLRPIAVGPVPGSGPTLRLPDDWQGRADVGYDLLRSDHFPPDVPRPSPPRTSGTSAPSADPPLWRIRRLVELAVAGGRRAAAEPARDRGDHGDVAVLRRSGFVTGAELVARLGAVAAHRTRDVFGRLDADDPDRYAAQWLATAVYLAAAEAALDRGTWRG
ncbi:hypothetical protein AB0L35_31120 [Streptomyces sp. NPDC052309]|uniref:hypothetical protein n=1 Tax=Streptomyces sp. NPDC052309 TaxID=3155421 RepID=UPI0034299537